MGARVGQQKATIALAAVWVAAALLIDGSTFHLAPLIVAGSVPIAAKDRPAGSALFGAGAALLIGLGLLLGGRLDGPSLLPWGDAFFETVLASAAGGLAGYAISVTAIRVGRAGQLPAGAAAPGVPGQHR